MKLIILQHTLQRALQHTLQRALQHTLQHLHDTRASDDQRVVSILLIHIHITLHTHSDDELHSHIHITLLMTNTKSHIDPFDTHSYHFSYAF